MDGWGGVGGVTMILRQSQFDLTSTGLLELSLAINLKLGPMLAVGRACGGSAKSPTFTFLSKLFPLRTFRDICKLLRGKVY